MNPKKLIRTNLATLTSTVKRIGSQKANKVSGETESHQAEFGLARNEAIVGSTSYVTVSAKAEKKTKNQKVGIPPPTSPHKFHEIPIANIVAEIANINSMLSLACL